MTVVLCAPLPLLGQVRAMRDSAGVRIVTTPPRTQARYVFQLHPTPVFDVGGLEVEPATEFDHKNGYITAVRLSSGELVVADRSRLHYFDHRGHRRFVVGTVGSGPAEFRAIVSLCVFGDDSIAVSDAHNRRVTVLAKDGTVVREMNLGRYGVTPFTFCFADGGILTLAPHASSRTGQREVSATHIVPSGETARPIGHLPGHLFDIVLGHETAVVAHGDKIVYSEGSRSEYHLLETTGRLQMIVRMEEARRPVTTTSLEAKLRDILPPSMPLARQRESMDDLRRTVWAEYWPTVGRLLIAPGGRVWVQDYRMSSATADGWTAFAPDGTLLGRLNLPRSTASRKRLDVLQFGNEVILARWWDLEDAVHISAFRMSTTLRTSTLSNQR